MKDFGLYPVITEEFCSGRSSVFVLKEVIRAGIKIVQLREKKKNYKEHLALAKEYRKITKDNGIIFILNDNLEIALEAEADGVHLGQNDAFCSDAKKFAPALLIGVSTHNEMEIERALSDNADYINIGPVFTTSTKQDLAHKPLGIDYLKKYSGKIPIPFSVMGGIKKEHIPVLLDAGVKNIAMITELTQAPDIYERTLEIIGMIEKDHHSSIL